MKRVVFLPFSIMVIYMMCRNRSTMSESSSDSIIPTFSYLEGYTPLPYALSFRL